jgi:hypothetical protein
MANLPKMTRFDPQRDAIPEPALARAVELAHPDAPVAMVRMPMATVRERAAMPNGKCRTRRNLEAGR